MRLACRLWPLCHQVWKLAADGIGRNQIADPHEVRHEARRRSVVEIFGRTGLNHHAMVHADDLVGQSEGLLLIVRHHQGWNAERALDMANFISKLGPNLRIKCRKRFVEKQDAGIDCDCPCQRNPLLLSAGKLTGELAGNMRQLHQFQKLGHPP